jgi:uncharacterized OsmC-like protein
MSKIVNGIDIDALGALVEAVKADPAKGLYEFRSETSWIGGARARTKIRDFTLEADEPESLLGSNTGPNAVEMVLASLGSCLTVGFAYNAAVMGIGLRSLEIEIKGGFDVRGFLGMTDQARPGYQSISVICRINSDAPHERLMELCQRVRNTSPVGDIIGNAEPLEIILEIK